MLPPEPVGRERVEEKSLEPASPPREPADASAPSASVAGEGSTNAIIPRERIKRDFGTLAETMAGWFRSRGIDGARLEDLSYPVGAGESNETILFTLVHGDGSRQGLVLRIAPRQYQLFMDINFEEQCRLLSVLAGGRHVRVPEIVWEEADRSVLGERFFVMRRLSGYVPVSFPPYNSVGRLFDATPRERERLWLNALVEMTRIHAVPVAEVEFLRRGGPGTSGLRDFFDRELAAYHWGRAGVEVPFLEEAIAWLTANFPAAPVDGLSWGDARIGNMMFDDSFNVRAVFDWEQASLGGGQQDLGWWLAFDTLSSTSIGHRRLAGLGDRAATIAAWEALTGQRATDLRWYEYFSGFRLATIMLRKSRLDRRSVPGNNISNNVFTRLMAGIREMPPPPDLIESM